MKLISATLLIFLSCANFFAQDKKETSVDKTVIDFSTLQENNNPACRESGNFGFRKGKITKIINGKTVLFSVNDEYESQTYKVILAGISLSKSSSKLKKLLIEKLLNEDVVVIGDEFNDGSNILLGIIHTYKSNAGIGGVNRYILTNGLAKYIKPKKHLVPNYMLCEYSEFEKQAKEKKIGIWAK